MPKRSRVQSLLRNPWVGTGTHYSTYQLAKHNKTNNATLQDAPRTGDLRPEIFHSAEVQFAVKVYLGLTKQLIWKAERQGMGERETNTIIDAKPNF